MIITIGGMPGSGKSTIAKKLAEKLDYKFYSMGALRGKMAMERGMTLDEFNKLGEEEDFTDKEVDEYQKKLGENEDDLVIDGRMSFYFIPHSIKIFLDVDLEEAAKRIFKNPRKDEKRYKTIKDVAMSIKKRVASDKIRYRKYYNINCYDRKHYDFILDTTNLTIDEAVQKILEFIKRQKPSF